MNTVDFYFDCSSPWTFLGFESLQQLISKRPDLEVNYKPILVGGVFNTVNPSVYENRANPVPAKQKYYQKDLQDWARHVGVVIDQPPVFPVNSVRAMRGALFADAHGRLVHYARQVFTRYWSDLQDISQLDVLHEIVVASDLDPTAFFTYIEAPACKAALRDNTTELVNRGGFGSPTFFLNGEDMYFGNDRMVLLAARLHPPT